MDEVGYARGDTPASTKVITTMKNTDARRKSYPKGEWTSIIECINAVGGYLPTWTVYKGANPTQGHADRSLPASWYFSYSDSGFSTNEIGLGWLTKVFIPLTKPEQLDQWRLLLLDNHESHVNIEFMDLALKNKILLLPLLPHTTYKCQPLDVGIFGALGHFVNDKLAREVRVGQPILSRIRFMQIYEESRRHSMTELGIKSSFRHAAIWPPSQRKVREILDSFPKKDKQQQGGQPATPNAVTPPPQQTPQTAYEFQYSIDIILASQQLTPTQQIRLKKLRKSFDTSTATASLYKDELDQYVTAKDSAAAKKGTKKRIQGVSKFFTNEEALVAIAQRDQQEVKEAQQKATKQLAKQEAKQQKEADLMEVKRLKNELLITKKRQREVEAENRLIRGQNKKVQKV